MKTLLLTVALSLLLVPIAEAKPGNGRGNGHGARSEEGFCPPGLAKRDPACIPPGQVGRGDWHDDDRDDDDDERDRDEHDREARVETAEPDPVMILLDVLDDIPARGPAPSDAAVLDLPEVLEPLPITAPVASLSDDPELTYPPSPDASPTGSEIGDAFRRATAEGSIGY